MPPKRRKKGPKKSLVYQKRPPMLSAAVAATTEKEKEKDMGSDGRIGDADLVTATSDQKKSRCETKIRDQTNYVLKAQQDALKAIANMPRRQRESCNRLNRIAMPLLDAIKQQKPPAARISMKTSPIICEICQKNRATWRLSGHPLCDDCY